MQPLRSQSFKARSASKALIRACNLPFSTVLSRSCLFKSLTSCVCSWKRCSLSNSCLSDSSNRSRNRWNSSLSALVSDIRASVFRFRQVFIAHLNPSNPPNVTIMLKNVFKSISFILSQRYEPKDEPKKTDHLFYQYFND